MHTHPRIREYVMVGANLPPPELNKDINNWFYIFQNNLWDPKPVFTFCGPCCVFSFHLRSSLIPRCIGENFSVQGEFCFNYQVLKAEMDNKLNPGDLK